RSPIEINPKLRICKGSNTWYQSSAPWCFTALPQPPIIFIKPPKQFSQLLRLSPNSTVITTVVDPPYSLHKNCIRFW
ncbi:hypothetical protein BHE74_00020132, partial [Ensete ventricosum]